MIRVLRCLLAALMLIPAPAAADVLVVWLPDAGTITAFRQAQWDSQRSAVTDLMDNYVGANNWAGVEPRGTKTLWVNTGTQVYGAATRQFDAVMIVGFSLTNGATIPFAGSPLRVDSLLRTVVWNSGTYGTAVPIIFVGAPHGDAFHWDQTSACSTGTSAYGGPYNSARTYYSTYMVGKPYVWKEWSTGASGLYAPPATATRAHGIWRPVVSYGATGITSAARRNCSALPCDNVTRSTNPDSVLLWARYRSSLDTAPRIFVQPGGINNSLFDMGLIKMALAMADSVTGGRVFEEKNLLPKRHNLWIRHAFSRGAVANQTSLEVGGTTASGLICAGAECDTLNIKAGIDSLNSLNIPFTVGVDPDSIATYPNEKAWWARAKMARYGLETYAGAIAARGSAASSTHAMDPLGYQRTRAVAASATLPTTCGSGDSTSYCLLKALRAQMEAQFPGKVDRAIFPAFSDWSPVSATAATLGAYEDSVAWAAANADWRAIVFDPIQATGNAGRQWSSNGGAVAGLSAPRGGNPNTRRVKTLDGRPFKFLAARFEPTGVDTFSMSGHTLGSEFLHGSLRGNWYPDAGSTTGLGLSIMYGHDFKTRTRVLAFNAAALSATGANPGRRAFWEAKWITNQWKATDSLLPAGKQLDVWDYAENVSPRP